MDTGVYWEVFENTGSIEAYLAYCKTEEVVLDSSSEPDIVEINSIEGEE